MRDWVAAERSVTWMDEGFDPEWLPAAALEHFSLRRRPATGQVGIDVPGYVGAIGLRNGDRLRIEPKNPSSFMRLLAACNGIDPELVGRTTAAKGADASPLSLLTEAFVGTLSDILGNGRLFRWEKKRVRSSFAPASVDWADTAINLRTRAERPFSGCSSTRTYDTPEARVLSVASRNIRAALLSKGPAPDGERLALLRRFMLRGDRLHILDDVRDVSARLAAKGYHGQRAYYGKALRTALMILGFDGISYEAGHDLGAEGFLVNSDDLFEEWVRVSLREAITGERLPYSVSKERRYERPLFVAAPYYLVPDVLIRQGADLVALGDAKNKTPGIDDFYQMLSYLSMYGLDKGFLMASDGSNGGRVEELRTRGGPDLSVNVYHLDMADLEACRDMFRKALRWLF